MCIRDRCKLVRSKPDIKNIPIIMLTAKSQEEDKIKGLGAGADDYVTKPFSVPELMARVKTNMRRAPLFEEKEKLIVFEDITMDLTERKVRRGDNYLHLSPTEFRLLKMLLKEPGKVFSREVLLKSVWGENIYVESRTVDVHIPVSYTHLDVYKRQHISIPLSQLPFRHFTAGLFQSA